MSRVDKINELLRWELANLITKEIPMTNGLITITHVDCSPDLKNAKISISVLPEKFTGTALKKLRQTNSLFSKELKNKLKMKFIPKFNWIVDPQERYAIEIEKSLKEIRG